MRRLCMRPAFFELGKLHPQRSFFSLSGPVTLSPEDTKRANRLRFIPGAMVNHLCLGSIFAWSIFNKPLTTLKGVVVPSSSDWLLPDISLTFSLVMGGFVWGSVLSRKLEQWGPRACGLMGAACLGGGFGLGGLAVHLESLPVLYAGGLLWGIANGLSYVPPVAMLLKWFPDRKGFASGSCLVGFGGGALVAAPLFTNLLHHFRTAPQYLGSVAPAVRDGKLFVGDVEVVMASAADLVSWPDLLPGAYAVGTGSTGADLTLLSLGALYSGAMAVSALMHRLPATSVEAPSVSASSPASAGSLTSFNVGVSTAMKTPQFALLWSAFGLSIMGSYGILAAGQTMLLETFGRTLPDIVNGVFAASFVAGISVANLGGRLFWSNVSDVVVSRNAASDPFWGRRRIFSAMWGLGPPLYLVVFWAIHHNAENPSVLALSLFCGSVCGIISSFGGAAATWPAFIGDIWGTKNVGILAARQLSVVLPAAFLGPRIVTALRERGIKDALKDLSDKVPDGLFLETFGASKDQLEALIASKTVTINRLLEILGPSVTDPTPFLYDNMLFLMAGLQGVSFVLLRVMRPVNSRFHEK